MVGKEVPGKSSPIKAQKPAMVKETILNYRMLIEWVLEEEPEVSWDLKDLTSGSTC